MPSSEALTAPLARSDLADLAALMREGLDSPEMSPERLAWWYLRNPAGWSSVRGARASGRLVGAATMNGAVVGFRGVRALVGMPQNVVVAGDWRGRGLFGRLYRETEEDARSRGIELLLTFTNAASTPIFLGKFGFRRAVVPSLLFLPALPMDFLARRKPEACALPPAASMEPASPARAAFVKPRGYLQWRYGEHGDERYSVFSVPGGVAIVRVVVKRKLKLALLMDLVLAEGGLAEDALRTVRGLCPAFGCIGVLAFENSLVGPAARRLLHFDLGARFNFLMKPLASAPDERRLPDGMMDLWLGDLDFF